MNVFDFDRQMAMSQGTADAEAVDDVLLAQVPDAVMVRRAASAEDRSGTDWWVKCRNGDELSVDAKVRALDPVERFGTDDLALETWSVVGRRVGWTLDAMKRTDYVLWWWQTTGRFLLLPMPMLRAAFAEHQDEWTARYHARRQVTRHRRGDWESECVFVPRTVVWRAIYDRFGGSPTRRRHEVAARALARLPGVAHAATQGGCRRGRDGAGAPGLPVRAVVSAPTLPADGVRHCRVVGLVLPSGGVLWCQLAARHAGDHWDGTRQSWWGRQPGTSALWVALAAVLREATR